jgi:hypothetical protein
MTENYRDVNIFSGKTEQLFLQKFTKVKIYYTLTYF